MIVVGWGDLHYFLKYAILIATVGLGPTLRRRAHFITFIKS